MELERSLYRHDGGGCGCDDDDDGDGGDDDDGDKMPMRQRSEFYHRQYSMAASDFG